MDYLKPVASVIPGARGQLLEALARASGGLSLTALAERSGVSRPHVSREVERLEDLGIVSRGVVGPSHQVALTTGAVGAWIRELAQLDQHVWSFLTDSASSLAPWVVTVVVFGSFARGTARADSDIDVVVITDRDTTDEAFDAALAKWADDVSSYAGNPVAEIVMSADELREHADEPVWQAARRDGVALVGDGLGALLDGERVA